VYYVRGGKGSATVCGAAGPADAGVTALSGGSDGGIKGVWRERAVDPAIMGGMD
jgi:hypothetical protein